MLVYDAARAFRRLAPVPFAEVSTHALVAYDASHQVAATAGEAYMHRLPRMCRQCLAALCNARAHACGGKSVRRRRWARACRCLPIPHRALRRACMLRGGNTHRGLTHACALRCLGVGSGNGYGDGGSCLGFHRLPLDRHGHGRRRRGRIILRGTDHLRSDSRRVGRRAIDAVHVTGAHDCDRRNDSRKEQAAPEQAPARGQWRGDEQRLRYRCPDGCVA